jgi:phospholipase/carboxylesterase
MMHSLQLVESGLPLKNARKILIMLHGRGATAEDILILGNELNTDGFHLVAPQAANNSWYPRSFLMPVEQNEPWLSNAMELLADMTKDYEQAGFGEEQIYFLGFSQGACLTLEFTTRNARHWGGVIAYSGGLIGDILEVEKYTGNFHGTPVFIGNSDHDPHIPLVRCEESATIIKQLGGDIRLSIYPNMGHTVNRQEIEEANLILQAPI